ncbi:MAG: aminotransferase class I/II-fold pyridoxal phosphate-dependent enzyme [Oscillospiraceae bacterium]|nr:aminotransferase class I/II-fold pyridoxal phosphate-dependent enzyme [Oscillospiraceae bacterium]MBQ2202835.1 aminotransferase class I/II-fold pyridoxal phosphate-dependent enzyme [Oscillospiraceae bacterium]MBQ6030943.1 aminotransferase class I/II-fold pyridoxal phosphate-dependent enzyme [Oscillospiraceae bacterium]MEE3458364.1 aminotransferase class I/II-fold pyridoxal phosphate-dependent enzyme [Candidatus Faecousia sp.]
MVNFESDYIAGAHPKLMQRLLETNLEPGAGYGDDRWSRSAERKILDACGCPDGSVFFLSGGTQVNVVAISALLRPWEGVVTAETGHIHVHEAGGLEAIGCKLLLLPERDGKLTAAAVRELTETVLADENREHVVWPGVVYVTNPTEWGSLYTRRELEDIAAVCRQYGLRLYLDGARLAYGLASRAADLDLKTIAALCDAFYIGGTKCGALCGEALVFPHGAPAHFANYTKKRLAMLAKGRVFGVQFDALFTDGLYWEIGRHGIEAAERLKEILRRHGLPMFRETPTNQQFVVLENEALARLREQVAVSYWSRADETHTVVRLATSWSTTEADLETLDRALGG